MKKTATMGVNNVIVKVSPKEVEHLRDDEIIIVSRRQLNAQLAFMEMSRTNTMSDKRIGILKCAINDMMEQERKQKTMVSGARMRVSDVKQIFSRLEQMPENSFAQIRA